MKNKFIALTLVLGCLVVLTIGFLSFSSQSTQAQVSANQKWEYKVLNKGLVTVSEEKMNQAGNEGWELVAVETQQVNGQTTQVRYVFKRPKN